MRQTQPLSPPTVVALAGESLQVVASPGWERVLPDVISADLSLDAWAPTAAGPRGACSRFFPRRRRPSPHGNRVGFPACSVPATSRTGLFSRLQPLRYVQASEFASHPDRSYRGDAIGHRAAVAFSFEQNTCRYRSHASNKLAVRIGKLTAWGLSPHKTCSLVGCSCHGQTCLPVFTSGGSALPFGSRLNVAYGAPNQT